MIFIYLLILSLICLSCFGSNSLKNYRNIVCTYGFAVLIILHTFVNPNLSDLKAYIFNFEHINSCSFSYLLTNNGPELKAEVGYRLFTKFISLFTSSEVMFLFVVSIIILSGYYYAIRKYSPVIVLSILLVITGPYIQSLFVLRQHIAMSLVLFTYPLIINRKFLWFCLLMILAFSFHQTALIFFPTYFIFGIKRESYLVWTLIGAFIVFFTLFSLFLNSYVSNFSMGTAQYGQYYLETSQKSGANPKMAILMLSLLCFRIAVLKNSFFKGDKTKLLSIILCLATIFSFAGIGFIGSSRLNMYYTIIPFLVLPDTLIRIKDKFLRVSLGSLYWIMTFFFFYKQCSEFSPDEFWFFSPNI